MSDDKRVTGGFLGLGGDPPYIGGAAVGAMGRRPPPPPKPLTVLEELRRRRVAAGAKLTRLQQEIEETQVELDQCGRAIDALAPPEPASALSPAPASGEEGTEYGIEIPEGFTKWEGGECPIEDGAQVELIWHSEVSGITREVLFSSPGMYARNWHHAEDYDHIIAYRLLDSNPETNEGEYERALQAFVQQPGAVKADAATFDADELIGKLVELFFSDDVNPLTYVPEAIERSALTHQVRQGTIVAYRILSTGPADDQVEGDGERADEQTSTQRDAFSTSASVPSVPGTDEESRDQSLVDDANDAIAQTLSDVSADPGGAGISPDDAQHLPSAEAKMFTAGMERDRSPEPHRFNPFRLFGVKEDA